MICLGIAIALTGLLPAARSFTFSGRPTGQTKGFEMEQWEYWTGFIWANAEDKDVKEFYMGIRSEESAKGYQRWKRKKRWR